MKPIRLMLVDDQTILLDTLRRVFDDDAGFKVVGVAADADTVCAQLDHASPDIVLLDVQLGETSGFDLIARLRMLRPDMRIVMFSMYDHPMYAQRADELGADAYLTKGLGFELLRANLLELARIPARAADAATPAGPFGSLTPRELHVLRGTVLGHPVKEIASGLGIGLSSVGTYLQRARTKLGVETRAELLRAAAALGLATPAGHAVATSTQPGDSL